MTSASERSVLCNFGLSFLLGYVGACSLRNAANDGVAVDASLDAASGDVDAAAEQRDAEEADAGPDAAAHPELDGGRDASSICEQVELTNGVDSRRGCAPALATASVCLRRSDVEALSMACIKRLSDAYLYPVEGRLASDLPAGWGRCSALEESLRAAAGACPQLGAEFVVKNASAAAIYIQRIDVHTNTSSIELYVEGQEVQYEDLCQACTCSECAQPCAACGRAKAAVQRIDPGSQYAVHWDGNAWEFVVDACGPRRHCDRPLGIPEGELELRVGYSQGFGVTREFGSDDEVLTLPVRYASRSFRYEDGAPIVVEVR